MTRVRVIGGGLAGSEAALQCARAGVPVTLHEMRPVRTTAAHRTDRLGELVCSNSFKTTDVENAHGLLKAELQRLSCALLEIAVESRIPAGAALAVDRERFAGRRFAVDVAVAGLAFAYSIWMIGGSGYEVVFKGFLLLTAGIPVYVWMRWQAARGDGGMVSPDQAAGNGKGHTDEVVDLTTSDLTTSDLTTIDLTTSDGG